MNSSTIAICDAPATPPIHLVLSNRITITEEDTAEETYNKETEIPTQQISATTKLQPSEHKEKLNLVCSESPTQLKALKQKVCAIETASERSLERDSQLPSSTTETETPTPSINSTMYNEITSKREADPMKQRGLEGIEPGREESFQIRPTRIQKLLSNNPISNVWGRFRSRRRLRKSKKGESLG